MRRRVTATRVMLIIPLWLVAGAVGAAQPGRASLPAPVLAHVANNAPAAVGLLPEDVQAPIPAGRPAQSPLSGRVAAVAVAAGLAASFGLLLRRVAGRSGLDRFKSAPRR